jgi:ribosomal-protein-alanine N-acetyltransferase
MDQIVTSRLRLDPAVEEDWAGYAPILQDPATARYSDLPQSPSLKRCQSFMGWMAKLNTSGRGRAWMMRHKGGSDILGAIRFNRIDRKSATGLIGYELAQSYWGQGLMTEALLAVAHYGFDALELFRLEAWAQVENHASCRVLEKAGFEMEGVQRKKLVRAGVRFDLRTFARLRDDPAP